MSEGNTGGKMRRGLKSNTSIGSAAPVNFFKSGDSPMSRNPIKIWEIKIDSGRRKWPHVALSHHVPAVFADTGTVANFASACSLWHPRPANTPQFPGFIGTKFLPRGNNTACEPVWEIFREIVVHHQKSYSGISPLSSHPQCVCCPGHSPSKSTPF